MKSVKTFIFIAGFFCLSVALAQSNVILNDDIQHPLDRVADAAGQAVTADSDPNTFLYTSSELEHKPVVAPDGRHITLGEFLGVTGEAQLECTADGTVAAIDLSGLIPHGVYTMWLMVFDEPGFDGTMDNLAGAGAYGSYEGDANAFTASETGEASIQLIAPATTLSVIEYDTGNCLISDEYDFHMVGTYHIQGELFGAEPGPPGSEAFQFGFMFKEGQAINPLAKVILEEQSGN